MTAVLILGIDISLSCELLFDWKCLIYCLLQEQIIPFLGFVFVPDKSSVGIAMCRRVIE
jgi:hypothetical protein